MPQNLKTLLTQSFAPKITNVATGSATAVVPAGGQTVTVTGTGFQANAVIWVNNSSVSTTFVSSTSLTFSSTAQSVGFYQLSVNNPDGTVAIRPGGLIYNSAPNWTTPSGALDAGTPTIAYSTTLVATGGTINYSIVSGSLPTGLGLNSTTGVISGTPTTVEAASFTVAATNEYNQVTNRAFSISIVTAPSSIDYIVVAGGGGGGARHGGGGGAGGYLTGTASISSGITYTITVGNGGTGGNGDGGYGTSEVGGTGGNSSISGSGFSTITSIRGGGGGASAGLATNGGSGGGDAGISYSGNPGKGVYPGSTYIDAPRQGYNGGVGGAGFSGGGGGGADGAGIAQVGNAGGSGGPGVANPFVGSTAGVLLTGTYYLAGGGSAGGYNGQANGTPGRGGGGQGYTETTLSGNGVTNSGGGGGGNGGGGSGQADGGNGGSGVVVIRYPNTYPLAAATTGSPTITTASGYRYYTFTGNGSITW